MSPTTMVKIETVFKLSPPMFCACLRSVSSSNWNIEIDTKKGSNPYLADHMKMKATRKTIVTEELITEVRRKVITIANDIISSNSWSKKLFKFVKLFF
jgi:hypothetical protein